MKGKLILLITAVFLYSLVGCKKKYHEIEWYPDKVETNADQGDKIAVDIYIDATKSMEGFVSDDFTVYGLFLDQAEANVLSCWKSANIRYFKFGEKIKPVSREEFLGAKFNRPFYRDKEIYKRTYIDSVVKHTDKNRLSILITDLFQDMGDVNSMVESIKTGCFDRNVTLGIVGLQTEYNGIVYDVPGSQGSFKLKTESRPFYALFFGSEASIHKSFDALSANDFVKKDQMLLLSSTISDTKVNIAKDRTSKYVNKKSSENPKENVAYFTMKEEGEEASFQLELVVNKKPYTIDYDEATIQPLVFKKSVTDVRLQKADSVKSDEITINGIAREDNKITASMHLVNDGPAGNYSYRVELLPNQVHGFKVPDWITKMSTDNPIPNTTSASLTYNFEKLMERLIIAANTMHSTKIADFTINIYKR